MRIIKGGSVALFLTLTLAACQKEKIQSAPDETLSDQATEDLSSRHGHGKNDKGFVYTMSNSAHANKVLIYRRSSDGELDFREAVATGGKGTGAGLGNQGAVTLSDDGKILLVVNPGSNTISSFRVTGNNLQLKDVIYSGGTQPVSVTQHHDLVYVLNSGGSGNISGFRLHSNGNLSRIHNSTRPLSSSEAGAAQISFSNFGKVLVVTEKATNKIVTYRLDYWDRPGAIHSITSANPTPFGFAVGKFGRIFVSEAAGGAMGASTLSSYRIGFNGDISLVTGPVGANQTAACWVVLTDNEKYAYTTNTGSNNISSFRVNSFGHISVSDAEAATSGMGPIDAALSEGSKFLYVLNGGSGSLQAYKVFSNGSLQSIQTVTGLPSGANGLAAE